MRPHSVRATLVGLLAAGSSAISAHQLDRLYTVPDYQGTTEVFLVAELTLTGCGWPRGHLSEVAVIQGPDELSVVIQAESTGELCPPTSEPFRSLLAVPLTHFLGQRSLDTTQRVRLEVRSDLGAVIRGAVTLNATAPHPVLPAAGAWGAEYGTTLWLDLAGDGLRLDFSADDLGDTAPWYDWPAPGRAIRWTGTTRGRGYAEVRFTELAPRVINGEVDRVPVVNPVHPGYLAFSDPFHGWLALPSGWISPIAKRHAGGSAVRFDHPSLPAIPDLSGDWVWLATGTALNGLRTHLSLIESLGDTRTWTLELASGGGGRVVCVASGDCTVYLTTRPATPPAPVMTFGTHAVGDRMILKDGEAVAFRVR